MRRRRKKAAAGLCSKRSFSSLSWERARQPDFTDCQTDDYTWSCWAARFSTMDAGLIWGEESRAAELHGDFTLEPLKHYRNENLDMVDYKNIKDSTYKTASANIS